MSGAQIVREVVQALASAAAPPASASLELAVAVGEGGLDVRFAAPRPRPAALERAAAALLAATAARLPEALRGRLAVEVGEVRSRLAGTGAAATLFIREYSLATCRGVVLGLRDAGAGPFAGPWSGVASPEELRPELPVVLEPSAVLALVCFALEVASGDVGGRDDAPLPGGLTVVDTAASSYPPQHHPFEADGAPSPDRPLIEEGRWRHRDAHRGGDVDPLFFLLTRPDRALRPLAAATHFSRRNLAVRCSRAVPLPAPAVLIESWRVRVGPRSGAVPFHADLSLLADDGRRLAVPTVLGLHLDPWEILRRIQGACGPAVPALEEDPIEGDGYGEAPPLATGLSLGDLLPPAARDPLAKGGT